MSTDADKEKPPGRVTRFFSWLGALPGRFRRSPLPFRAAVLVAVALVVFVVVAWTVFLLDEQSVPWRHSLSFSRVLVVLVLLVVIPLLVHRGLRLWLSGEISDFPDIDYAWNHGVESLARHGLRLDSIPVFLILGSANQRQERDLMAASGLRLRVEAERDERAPLRWYANADGVYLFCSEAGWLSALMSQSARPRLGNVSAEVAASEAPLPRAALTTAPALDGAPPEPPKPVREEQVTGTIMLDQYMTKQTPQQAAPAPAPAATRRPRGTMMLDPSMQDPAVIAALSTARAAAPVEAPTTGSALWTGFSPSGGDEGGAEASFVPLAPQDSTEQMQRLRHVCQLLRRARQPLCAINGVLTLLPFNTLQSRSADANEVERACRSDLAIIQRALDQRAPVTALVVGMEQEAGFCELVRRVGRERASVQRFGRGFDVRCVPTAHELEGFCSHVCGTFEDWIHTLFREAGALSRPGNPRLYGLLCKVRSTLQSRLSEILVGAFADSRRSGDDDPCLFSGIYFAAAGHTEDMQAFVKGVFDKLLQEQEQVEWTSRALTTNRHYLTAAYVGGVIDALLGATLVGLLARHFWLR